MRSKEQFPAHDVEEAFMLKKIFLTCITIAIAFLFSCTKEGNPPESGGSSLRDGGRVMMNRPDAQPPFSGFMVKILPEPPVVTRELQVVHSGQGTVSYEWQKNGTIIQGEQTGHLAKALFVKGDTITVIVRAGNGTGTASVVIANSPPWVTSAPFNSTVISAGSDIVVKPVGFDPDGDFVGFHYKWTVNGSEQPEDSSTLSGNRFKRGDSVSLTVIPYDQEGDGRPFVSTPLIIPAALPLITSAPPQHFQGAVYTYQVVAEDPDGDPLTYSLASAPAGMTINGKSGLITWQLNSQSAGSHQVEIVVAKPGGMKTSQRYTLAITLEGGK